MEVAFCKSRENKAFWSEDMVYTKGLGRKIDPDTEKAWLRVQKYEWVKDEAFYLPFLKQIQAMDKLNSSPKIRTC